MHINNKARWAETFTVTAPVIRMKSGLKVALLREQDPVERYNNYRKVISTEDGDLYRKIIPTAKKRSVSKVGGGIAAGNPGYSVEEQET